MAVSLVFQNLELFTFRLSLFYKHVLWIGRDATRQYRTKDTGWEHGQTRGLGPYQFSVQLTQRHELGGRSDKGACGTRTVPRGRGGPGPRRGVAGGSVISLRAPLHALLHTGPPWENHRLFLSEITAEVPKLAAQGSAQPPHST
ncbi:hypothetical protein Bbelb_188840 [Branchiostoma belcheri]|nr:hypothetical protein Bbelb_188840 [Branchiostoma belcheri]